MGKSTGGVKQEDPNYIETGDGAEVEFTPQAPFVCEPFKTCPGLGRASLWKAMVLLCLVKLCLFLK